MIERMHDADERQLLDEFARTGGDGPFREIVRRYAAMVFGVCRAVLGNSADAEDAAQATFLTLAHKASTLGRRPLAGWLHGVAWHIAMRARQAQRRRQIHEQRAAMMAQADQRSE